MINIIKYGQEEVTREFYKVACPKCGCEFELESIDFEWQHCGVDEKPYTHCPCCSRKLWIDLCTTPKYDETILIDYENLLKNK